MSDDDRVPKVPRPAPWPPPPRRQGGVAPPPSYREPDYPPFNLEATAEVVAAACHLKNKYELALRLLREARREVEQLERELSRAREGGES